MTVGKTLFAKLMALTSWTQKQPSFLPITRKTGGLCKLL
jgi:hypothetical protein